MTDVVVIGSCVQDLVSYTSRFPRPGESVRGTKFQSGFGGKGANQAVVAAKLGAKTAMVAKVGLDMFGPPTIENFRKVGINADHVSVTDKESTATATITVSESGENNIVVVLGANMELGVEEVGRAKSLLQSSRVLCCQFEIRPEITLAALKLGKECGVTTILNPAPGIPDVDLECLKYTDILCPNENEAEFLWGSRVEGVEGARGVAEGLVGRGVETVIITMGEKGCVFATKGSASDHIPCPKVNAVDTTGAGDAFVGALAYFTAQRPELPLKEKITRACQVASHSVQYPGTQTSYQNASDLPASLFK